MLYYQSLSGSASGVLLGPATSASKKPVLQSLNKQTNKKPITDVKTKPTTSELNYNNPFSVFLYPFYLFIYLFIYLSSCLLGLLKVEEVYSEKLLTRKLAILTPFL